MKTTIAKMLSYAGLILTVVPSLLVFAGEITFQSHKQLMLVGMLLWFATAPVWLSKSSS